MLIAGRYEATGVVAWGGMSEVHEFIDKHLNRKVMLKRVRKIGDFSRLVDEQKALLSLRSKHVVELLDIVEYEYSGSNEIGLILEKIEGIDLQSGSYTYDTSYLKTIWQIAAGLADVHAAGVIHRDIKPANIRLDHMGVIKILDFGLSRQVGLDDSTRSIAGTDGFMAPELFAETTINFTKAVDVYAFGQSALSLLDGVTCKVSDIAKRVSSLFSGDQELNGLLTACFDNNPYSRPDIAQIRDVIGARLLKNEHRARFYAVPDIHVMDGRKKSISFKTSSGSIGLEYDGYRMKVVSVVGNVTVNNRPLCPGDQISSSGVIIFRQEGSPYPTCVPYELSNPEVAV